MITLVDMGMGNLSSVVDAFERLGQTIRVTSSLANVRTARIIVLPGVGAFGDGMASLRANGLADALRRHVIDLRRPLLGICLGMHLLAEESEEHGRHRGLGLVPGRVVHLSCIGSSRRVPNMGWCDVRPTRTSMLWGAQDAPSCFYFAHSFAFEPGDASDVIARLADEPGIVAAVGRGAAVGVQFHPEKSQNEGLSLLQRFLVSSGADVASPAPAGHA